MFKGTYRQALCRESTLIGTAQALAEDFGQIVRTRALADLDLWLAVAALSRLPELVSFPNGIRRDYAAVAAALKLPAQPTNCATSFKSVRSLATR